MTHISYKTLRSVCMIMIKEIYFENSRKNLLVKYNVEENTQLNSIYHKKDKWTTCYIKNAFTLDMRSTQLSENINLDIKSCTRSNLNINQFFHKFVHIVQEKRYNELQHDYELRQKIPRIIVQKFIFISTTFIGIHFFVQLVSKRTKSSNCNKHN